ncbi:hypothetical protein GIB67_014780 [Kingdonia uniflora]|uniref:Trichome birefringence-like N-terminal domain-containing protein n=1 Tax=Kingdonia uniflora TaxID=39325 RepID=A0A7J7NV36_9MAGN|nr:hypothetical protein GIB67_014780 [Kingdonia uniflora]
MEKQRSFSIKPTRLLVYSFTISSSILFITIFSFWVFQSTSSIPQQPLAHFNSSKNISVSFKTIKSQALSGLSVNKSSLRDTQNKGFDNISRGSLVLVGKSVLRNTLSSKVGDGLKRVEVLSDGGERVEVEVEEKRRGDCDVSNGRWVYDESYPLYTNRECPFIDEGFNCEANGRLDRDYVKWRWQPHDCIIPRFNAVKMLELIRGKRLVFVGDSINRNQWESMLCLLRGAVKDPKRVYETHGRRISKDRGNYSFKFLDYKCTVEYYVTHFLVREGKARVNKKRIQTLRIDAIDRSSSRWKGADILVFNTAHWWSHYKTKSG